MKNKICVYTCITGDYDRLQEIKNKESGIDYLCFTNNKNLTSKTWKIIQIENDGLDNHRLSRKIKMLGHKIIDDNYEISMWMDAPIVFQKSIKEFIKKYYDEKEAPFSSFKHYARNCIYEEAKACVKHRKETKENVKKQIEFLEKEHYPKNNGLYEMTVFIKNHHNEKVKETMKMWFEMVCQHSKRDQLSFMYCIWKTNLKIKPINLNMWNNEWFISNTHNYDKEISKYRVYFDNGQEYNIDFDFQGEFQKKGDIYSINLTAPCDSNELTIELSRIPFIKMLSFQINKEKNFKIQYSHYTLYKDYVIFHNENGALKIDKKIKKGTKLTMKMELKLLDKSELVELTNYLKRQGEELLAENKICQSRITGLQNDIDRLNTELHNIVNSKSWKLIRAFTKFKIRRKNNPKKNKKA